MGRSRVLSFMSAFGPPPKSPTSASSPSSQPLPQASTSSSSPQHSAGPAQGSPTPIKNRAERSSSRPMSMVQAYQPPLMEIAQDTIPELQPIFTFLNSHSNKLYQEGYFLKLNDLDSHGRPNNDRSWTECFAQLVGTILSLWDAAALDAAGQDGEVAPKFINLADASIKMIETLPTRSQDAQPLQNVLSISTAGKNRYLFHFNSLHSLTQWTAGIRLAMFEHSTLQEAYTGSLIAGKGKNLNNIRVIMEKTKLKTEDWARVRFGAGTPWRRCWCVISPPPEKELQRLQKSLKKKSAYDRTLPMLKGDVKFYDTKKTKKAQPIATINDAYSAYAIYPQSKPLIDQSTLVKVEGTITIHSAPETTTEGFVFVMPEVHPGVTGFEMMLRWLFPVYDVFALYGRPTRLIADTLDTRSLMFALPQERRYGYLEILDVATLIHENGSPTWTEKEWRAKLKELTSSRITKLQSNGSRQRSRASSYRGHRNSLPSRAGALRFEDGASINSSPSFHEGDLPTSPSKPGSAPPGEAALQTPTRPHFRHNRSVSDVVALSAPQHRRSQRSIADNPSNYTPSGLSYEASPSKKPSKSLPPLPPAHGVLGGVGVQPSPTPKYPADLDGFHDRSSSESERRLKGHAESGGPDIRQDLRPAPPLAPVAAPPAFAHEAGAKPPKRPHVSSELRRANSRMSITTLSQLADAGQMNVGGKAAEAVGAVPGRADEPQRDQSFHTPQRHAQAGQSNLKNGEYVEDNEPWGLTDKANAGRSNPDYRPTADNNEQHSGQLVGYHHNQSQHHGQRMLPPFDTSSRQHSSGPLSSQLDPAAQWQRGEECSGYHNATSHGSTYEHPNYPVNGAEKVLPTPSDHQHPETYRPNTSRSISRKPLPGTSPFQPDEPTSPVSISSLESLRKHVVDEDALDRVNTREPDRSYTLDSLYDRRSSEGGSVYDNDSAVSPDYASTRKSTETKRSKVSVEKPRAGVLKTVGRVDLVPDQVTMDIQAAIPAVDFGPTHRYAPEINKRPGSGAALTLPVQERASSADRLTPSTRSHSPADLKGGGEVPISGRPNERHERSPTRDLKTLDLGRRTPSGGSINDKGRSVAWQPGASIGAGNTGPRQSITPEQFVQQRAAASRVTPVYAHGRKPSGQGTPPMISRNSSGEWPLQQHSRQASFTKELPSRPQSRGSPIILNPSTDYSAHLSAREQEHVARVTGSPFLNMAHTPNRQAPSGGGLIGAIEAREKEKRDMKEGLSGHMVQHAIAQRQQHSQGFPSSQQAFPSPSPQMHIPGQWPPSPGRMLQQYPVTPQQQYGWGPSPTITSQQQQYMSQFSQQPQQHSSQQHQHQQRPQWPSPAAQQYWSATQNWSPNQKQLARPNPPSGLPQQTPYQPQGQQSQYGPYFGNGQGNR